MGKQAPSKHRKAWKIVLVVAILLLIVAAACGGAGYYLFLAPQFFPQARAYVYIDRDDTVDSLFCKVAAAGNPRQLYGFKHLATWRGYADRPRTGRYAIEPGDNARALYNRLAGGNQSPMPLTIPSVRTLEQLAGSVGKQLMVDSVEIARLMDDSLLRAQMGYTIETLPSLFIPDTYEVYWNISAEEFFRRMQREHRQFWNPARMEKASALDMTPEEISTLASIVEEETNNNAEKPMVAGLYLNRLKAGIPLQADPTVKFAARDFGRRRITNSLLAVDSPYNTYLHTGLPPGPIRIPTPVGLDAVLDYVHHNYLYMCAKEDFSGTHNFAATYSEHLRNARKYWQALNARKIYK